MSIRRLGVNVDHVATLRQARQARYPDPLAAALIAERAGADQITVHLRGDRRHIQDDDLFRLRSSIQTELNVECACTDEMLAVMAEVRPQRVTLVAERPGEVTTEGGLDVLGQRELVQSYIEQFQRLGITVSLFIDPDEAQIRASLIPGVDMVELNTAAYSETGDASELARLAQACFHASELGFVVAAGHGLNLHNLRRLVVAVPDIEEYNIGHALIGDAVFLGLEESIQRYKRLLA